MSEFRPEQPEQNLRALLVREQRFVFVAALDVLLAERDRYREALEAAQLGLKTVTENGEGYRGMWWDGKRCAEHARFSLEHSAALAAGRDPAPPAASDLDAEGVLWVAAVDRVPIQERIEWVARMKQQVAEINAARFAAPVQETPKVEQ